MRRRVSRRAPIRPGRLGYTGIPVADLARSVRFYTRTFGLRVVDRGDATSAGLGKWVYLEDPETGHGLELYWAPSGRRAERRHPPRAGLRHLGFLVEAADRAEFERAYLRAVRSGGIATRVTPERTEGRIGWLRDPDGNWIELARVPPPRRGRRTRPVRSRRARRRPG